jgi:hypothetical protein
MTTKKSKKHDDGDPKKLVTSIYWLPSRLGISTTTNLKSYDECKHDALGALHFCSKHDASGTLHVCSIHDASSVLYLAFTLFSTFAVKGNDPASTYPKLKKHPARFSMVK